MLALEPADVIAGIARAVLGMPRAPSSAHVRALAEGLLSLTQGAPVLEASATPAKRAPVEPCTSCQRRPRDAGYKSCTRCRDNANKWAKDKRDRAATPKPSKAAARAPKAAGREARSMPAPADASPAADEEPPGGLVSYERFNAGVDYSTAYQMLWSGSDDRRDWKQKSRGVVLGLMSRWKREAYAHYLSEATKPVEPCEASCFCTRCRAD